MIITRLMGGHSNQLFQYAIGRQLAIKHRTKLKLDLSWFDETYDPNVTTQRSYELVDYPVVAGFASKSDLERVDIPDRPKPRFHNLKLRFGQPTIRYVKEAGLGFDKNVLNAPDNVYLDGYWQNEKYFKNIRDILLREFEPVAPMNRENQSYLKQIQDCEAISLHVRREDYATNANANKYHGLTQPQYYSDAVKLIKKNAGDKKLHIFIFSKDMDWCKKNLKYDLPMTFIQGNEHGSEDMRLMKHCKHNIMANSSFSWWGAWLNQNPGKIVIAPKIWFLDEGANKQMDNIPKGWTRL